VEADWGSIADWYAELVHGGSAMHQFSRGILLNALPDRMSGLDVLDVGRGEGIVSRALATAGARVVGIDSTRTLIAHAEAAERARPAGVVYRVDDGTILHTVADDSVDGVIAALSLNNIADLDAALGSVRRVLRPNGFLTFTVPHPCFDAPAPRQSRRRVGCIVSLGTTSPKGSGDRRTRTAFAELAIPTATISTYLTAVLDHGFTLRSCGEPAPSDAVRAEAPHRLGLPPFLLVSAKMHRATPWGRPARPNCLVRFGRLKSRPTARRPRRRRPTSAVVTEVTSSLRRI
jgi:SAM-dependent methyltransferase